MNRLRIKNLFKSWAAVFHSSAKHPIVRNLHRRHPLLFRFILLRFDPSHFRGLPFTLFIIGVFMNAIILSEIAEEIRVVSKLRTMDMQLSLYLFKNRSDFTAEKLLYFTRLGSSPTVLAVFGVLTFILIARKRFHAWIAILAALVTSTMTAYAGKVYYKFPRPPAFAWYEEFSYSFPSGHATVTMAYYGLLFYLLMMFVERSVVKLAIAFFAFLFIGFMGFSRVYLGVHYLSDVISGFGIGFVWLLFSITLLGWLDFRKGLKVKN